MFTNSMMTVAAIDRLIDRAMIIGLQAESFRKQATISRAILIAITKTNLFNNDDKAMLLGDAQN